MDKVIEQAELLGEAILQNEQYIAMHLAEQAVINDDAAQQLIQTYSERKDAMQKALAEKPLDQEVIAKASSAVKETEAEIAKNVLIELLRVKSAAYQDMMQQVNGTISRIISGEPENGCSGSCESCGCSCDH